MKSVYVDSLLLLYSRVLIEAGGSIETCSHMAPSFSEDTVATPLKVHLGLARVEGPGQNLASTLRNGPPPGLEKSIKTNKYGPIRAEMAPFGLKLGRIEAHGLNNMFICLPTPFRAKFYLKNVWKTDKSGKMPGTGVSTP